MSAEFAFENFPGDEPARSYDNHPFADTNRLFIMRRPLDIAIPSTVRARNTIRDLYNQFDSLEEYNLPTDIIEISTAPDTAGMVALYDRHNITDSDGVMVIGGDGTSSNANAAALRVEFGGPLVHVGRGNARDQAHMLFRRRDIKDPAGAMLRSRLADLYMMQITTDKPSKTGEYTTETTAYWSAGELIYDITKEVGSDEFRAMTGSMSERAKLQAEAKMTFSKVGTGCPIAIEDDGGKRLRSDLVLSNGQRMAKQVHFGGLRLLRPGYGRLELIRSTYPAVTRALSKAALGVFPHIQPEETYTFTITTQDGDTIKVQRDGEIDEYPDGTTFTAALAPRPLSVAATRAA